MYYIRFIILCILIQIHSVYESETFIVYTVYIILCILYSVYCIILCLLCCVYYTVYITDCILCILYSVYCIISCLLCCVYYTVYTNTVYTILCIKNTNFHHFEVFTKKCTPLGCTAPHYIVYITWEVFLLIDNQQLNLSVMVWCTNKLLCRRGKYNTV